MSRPIFLIVLLLACGLSACGAQSTTAPAALRERVVGAANARVAEVQALETARNADLAGARLQLEEQKARFHSLDAAMIRAREIEPERMAIELDLRTFERADGRRSGVRGERGVVPDEAPPLVRELEPRHSEAEEQLKEAEARLREVETKRLSDARDLDAGGSGRRPHRPRVLRHQPGALAAGLARVPEAVPGVRRVGLGLRRRALRTADHRAAAFPRPGGPDPRGAVLCDRRALRPRVLFRVSVGSGIGEWDAVRSQGCLAARDGSLRGQYSSGSRARDDPAPESGIARGLRRSRPSHDSPIDLSSREGGLRRIGARAHGERGPRRRLRVRARLQQHVQVCRVEDGSDRPRSPGTRARLRSSAGPLGERRSSIRPTSSRRRSPPSTWRSS